MQYNFFAKQCICCGHDTLSSSPAVLMPFVAKRVFNHEPVEISEQWGLRDLRSGMAYTLCKSLQCQQCGALFLDYRFTDEQMAALYHNYRDEKYNQERIFYESGYAEVVNYYHHREAYLAEVEQWLRPHLPEKPMILDWGGGTGINTPFLGEATNVEIHDISNVDVVKGACRADPASIGSRHYDLVACSQVLEHVSYPLDMIRLVLSALDDQSLLYVEVPHEALMREHPGALDLASRKHHWHEHVNFFTKAALHALMTRSGLEVVDMHFLPVNLGWRQGEIIGVLARLAR
ncbi:class I SAM-dependent methyltransferase [Castellaniella sp.]|uniref:class I SAM-dependent methyltransferase n=1 Tax=Castellaniella sp. TaxID=1955812 RepID=UPI002B0029D3|nr:class I SAM-dependent methyltransferase [Castellaniella sp.]